ncbi:MAG: MFS transporter [bacterium]
MRWRIEKVSVSTITFSAVTIWIGFYAWRIMFNNFAVEVFDATPAGVGSIQAAREIPGLLAFGVGALALFLSESRLAAISIVILGFGLILCGAAPSISVLGAATILMSFGFHYFEPTNSSQLLALSDSNKYGQVQGKLTSWESMAGLAGALIVMGMTYFFNYRQTFYLIGGAVTLVGLYLTFALPANRGKKSPRKVRVKRKYWLYYTLSLLRGCRRHIFTTFAIFLLVKNHELSITVVSALMLVNNLITIFTNRGIGRLSDRWGERLILVGCSAILIFVFAGYAFVEYLPLLIGLYVIDNILFGSSIALKSYLGKLAEPEDLTSCLSFGMTANHVTAVVIPVAGGVAWGLFGHQLTFLIGAVIVLVDMIFAFMVPSLTKPPQGQIGRVAE